MIFVRDKLSLKVEILDPEFVSDLDPVQVKDRVHTNLAKKKCIMNSNPEPSSPKVNSTSKSVKRLISWIPNAY